LIQEPRDYQVQLAVIGSGLAGFAASIFALDRGLATAQVGNTGAIAYTTGYLDLLGVEAGQVLDSPWEGLDRLRQQAPDHPLSRISDDDIRTALQRFTRVLSDMGIGYSEPGNRNLQALTPAGTTKPTLSVPLTMRAGIEARRAGTRTLIIDFIGLNGFSAREMVANFGHSWPGLTATRLGFPDMDSGAQVYPEVMARALQVPANRERLARRIKAVLGDAAAVGLPAILGIHQPDKVHADLQRRLGVPLFEIPTMPPAVAGIRLREMFEQQFPARGLVLVPQQKVSRLELNPHEITLRLRDSYGDVIIHAQAAVLATGRFLSGGLSAERNGIRETLLGLPVSQPDGRSSWHRQHYFAADGHPLNRAGIRTDGQFRPLGNDGNVVDPRLFAAGILLAGQDWVRERCGAGVAIASAFKAVESAARLLGG